jgi:hypothetical protein
MQARSEQVYADAFIVYVYGLGGGFMVFSLGVCRRVNAGAQ